MTLAPNSPEAIAGRVQSGRITWTGPVVLSFARLALAFLAQGVTALVLSARGTEDAYLRGGEWFTVHGTLVDLGSLMLLAWFLRREGLKVTDLFRAGPPVPVKRSLLRVPLYLLLLFIAGFGAAALTGLAVYGTAMSQPPFVQLPLLAGLYSTLVWPLVWGFVEQATYNGYAAPRVEALAKSRWALAIVCVGWAAQHIALPFRPDPAFWAYRFFPALAVAVCAVAIHLRTRNLLPLALSHWIIDLASGALTLAPPA